MTANTEPIDLGLNPRVVHYPVAADRDPAQPDHAAGRARWRTALTDAVGLIAVVWGVALAILVVGLPIALAVAVLLRLGRWAVGAF